ncbi:MAG: family 16 glycosylhydrolase [Candidatus Omnitrophica bacterium]|nr:family 16 glycosylhydrolase [Candidatus Omnitrophota bacterium]
MVCQSQRKHFFIFLILISILFSTDTISSAQSTTDTDAGYQLVWSDEFNGEKIDPANWEAMIGDGTEYGIPGWGNAELQYYTERPANAYVEDGNLVIVAHKEEYKGFSYTSARLRTMGKADFLYGKMEARIKLPSTQGVWPAFWMLPTDSEYGGWPLGGEIDILESVNAAPDRVMGSIFFGDPWPKMDHISVFTEPIIRDGKAVDLSKDFHIYAIEWQPYEIRWSMDGKVYSIQNEWRSAGGPYPAPFDDEFHFLLNIAIGGNGPGPPDESSKWPQKMLVDWVRVYQTENELPTLQVTSPAEGAEIPGDEPVVFQVDASDPEGRMERVDFHSEEELIGTATKAPYAYEWDAPDGCHKVKVRAVDADGFVNWTRLKIVKGKGCPPGPYHLKPALVPGRIEAEDFDIGPPGEAYSDYDAINHGAAYRDDVQVDIQDCSEGGFDIGWIIDGEWLKYTVEVEEPGKYDIIARTGSPEGSGRFYMEFDGIRKTRILSTPNTGEWQKYTDVIAKDVELSAGEQVMRVVVDKGGFNLNFIEIQKSHPDE